MEELLAHLGRNRFSWQAANRLDGGAHLSQVGATVPAHPQVQLEADPFQKGLASFEIVGDELGHFFTGQHISAFERVPFERRPYLRPRTV